MDTKDMTDAEVIIALIEQLTQLRAEKKQLQADNREFIGEALEHQQQVERLKGLLELIKSGDFDKMVDLAESLGIEHEHKREYKRAGDHETDARHTYPDREILIYDIIIRELKGGDNNAE